jgi:hypothetical protein
MSEPQERQFEVHFDCDASLADFILLRLLLKASHYNWHTFEVTHNKLYKSARIYFYSKTYDCKSIISVLAGLDEESVFIKQH